MDQPATVRRNSASINRVPIHEHVALNRATCCFCDYWFRDCGTRILRVVHGRDARATLKLNHPFFVITDATGLVEVFFEAFDSFSQCPLSIFRSELSCLPFQRQARNHRIDGIAQHRRQQ